MASNCLLNVANFNRRLNLRHKSTNIYESFVNCKFFSKTKTLSLPEIQLSPFAGCGRIVQVLNNGTVTSPNHPLSYDNNQDCTWILSSNPGSKIKLNFIEFDLQPPNQTQCFDFLQVQEGRQGIKKQALSCFAL